MTKYFDLLPRERPLVVFGTRDLDDRGLVFRTLKELTASFTRCRVLLRTDSPTARTKGPERLAEEWASKQWFHLRLYFPHPKARDDLAVAREMVEDATAGGTRKAYMVGFVRRGSTDPFVKAMTKFAGTFDAKLKLVKYSYED